MQIRATLTHSHNMETPRIFLTDYASYNDGTQFQFGHWVDLDDFSDAEEFFDYCTEHFEKADQESPLDEYGSTREEWMVTDYEGFPDSFYFESFCRSTFKSLYEYFELDEQERRSAEFYMDQHGYNIDQAMSEARNNPPLMCEDIWELFEMLYPEADEQSNLNPYLQIDIESFERYETCEFTDEEGNTWYVLNQ